MSDRLTARCATPSDRVILITGASRGLGRQIALACTSLSARVALLSRDREQLDRLAAEVGAAGGVARAWPTDICDRSAVAATVEDIVRRWGRIDVLINAAGIKIEGSVEQTGLDEALRAMQVNYLGAMLLCQAVLPHMRLQGAGHLVNVSSVLGKRATPGRAVYSASKAALNALTDALRAELRVTGIRVTLVCPGRLEDVRNGLLSSSYEHAARRIVRCLDKPRRELVLTGSGRVLVALNAVAPGVVDRIVAYWRLREGQGRAV